MGGKSRINLITEWQHVSNMVYFNQNYNIFDEIQKKNKLEGIMRRLIQISRATWIISQMKPISYYGLLLLRSKSNATSSTLLYPCRIAGSFIAHTTTSGTSSQQLVIFFQIMETSSCLYKVYTAKRLLQNRTVHWLIGEKLKKKESKPILRLCFHPRLTISKAMISKVRLAF